MVRGRVKMKLNRRRKDITKKKKKKKTRVPCNFCEFSSSRYGFGSSEQSLQDQDNEEAVLRKEVMRLRFLFKRMTGRDDSASFTELEALESHLMDVMGIVMDQKKKIMLSDEVESKQKNKAEDDGTSIPVPSTSSSEQREEENLLLEIEREIKRRKSESLQSEFDRLWIFNERMNGREIESMSCYYDLSRLQYQITYALMSISDQMTRPLQEKMCKAQRPKSVVKINADEIAMPKELRRSVRLANKKRNEES